MESGSLFLQRRQLRFWRFCFWHINTEEKESNITVHSVHSNVAKIHSRLPAAMEFWLVCLGISSFTKDKFWTSKYIDFSFLPCYIFFWSNCCPAVCKTAGCPQERNYPWTLSEKYIAGLFRKLFTLQFPFYLTENLKSQEASRNSLKSSCATNVLMY